ncbi:hypothetical protein SDC9_156720 [bioreactor metagenome]|uniref:Uncharacterized protein n=1 Tax=bioreactor metagenome TaxID=1076179 RepID=A0A645F6D0_9ZZZZ
MFDDVQGQMIAEKVKVILVFFRVSWFLVVVQRRSASVLSDRQLSYNCIYADCVPVKMEYRV